MEPTFPTARHSITFRMTVTVCAFLILFQAILAALTVFYFKREFKQTISTQQFTLLTAVTHNIDQKLSSSRKVVVDVSRLVTPEIVHDGDTAQQFLDNRPGTHSLFDNGLFLFSPDGRIIAEAPDRHCCCCTATRRQRRHAGAQWPSRDLANCQSFARTRSSAPERDDRAIWEGFAQARFVAPERTTARCARAPRRRASGQTVP